MLWKFGRLTRAGLFVVEVVLSPAEDSLSLPMFDDVCRYGHGVFILRSHADDYIVIVIKSFLVWGPGQ